MSREVIEMIERKIREYEIDLDSIGNRLKRAQLEVSENERSEQHVRGKIAELKATVHKLGGREIKEGK